MYSSSMSSIDDSVIESAGLDGASPIREFASIVLPLIYPTIATFLAVSVAGIFTNQFNLFSLYGDNPPSHLQNLGIFLYLKTYFAVVEGSMEAAFVIPATWGVLLTLVAAPITIFVRWALNKFGPSVN
jgi:ABC-type sugar transport system permease subunit